MFFKARALKPATGLDTIYRNLNFNHKFTLDHSAIGFLRTNQFFDVQMIPVSRFFTVQVKFLLISTLKPKFKDPSNALLSYTQKGIDFFEKLGQFSKEKAAIEEEYSTKLRFQFKQTEFEVFHNFL